MHYRKQTLDTLETVAGNFEADSSAELVFALARRSGKYADVPYKIGVLFALIVLLAIVYLPFQFNSEWFWSDTVLGFVLGWVLGRIFPRLTRLLTSRRRRNARVREAAEAVFVNRGVTLTRERTGILVYVSWLEQVVMLLWDVGIEKKVARTVLQAVKKDFERYPFFNNFPAGFETALEPLKKILDEKLPRPADDTNEIPNRPVVIK